MLKYMKEAAQRGDDGGFLKGLSIQIGELTKRLEAQAAEIKKANEERDEALARAATVEAAGRLSPEEREFFDALPTDAEKADFATLDPAARKARIAKQAKDADTIEIDCQTITKADVGAMFPALKAMAARHARLEQRLAEECEARRAAEYLAQAEEEMDHLPGDVAMKARVLRAIDEDIEDEEAREALAKMLAVDGGVSTFTSAFDVSVGRSRVHVFETRVSAIKNRDGCTYREAMQKARDEHPDEFEDWQAEHMDW
jgi:hypothetical protein